jgi:predicted nuclease of predicted toxin-antitoxin system
MKIKLDENLPFELAEFLNRLGHDVDTVLQENLKGKDDPSVWEVTQAAGHFLISQDLYFADIRGHSPGSHNGVLLVRLMDPSRENLLRRIVEIFEKEDVQAWNGCNVVATNQKVRVRKSSKPNGQ